jgi:hypothetical protein
MHRGALAIGVAALAWACGSSSDTASVADAAVALGECRGCSRDQACEVGVRECVGTGARACPVAELSAIAWRWPHFDDLLADTFGRAAFDQQRPGTVAAVDATTLTLDLEAWGRRVLTLQRGDVDQLFHAGEAVTLRVCARFPGWTIGREWLAEITSASLSLSATGANFSHHGSCVPTGVTAMGHAMTTCAVDAQPVPLLNRLAAPAELQLADGTRLTAAAGEQVSSGPWTFDVRASSLVVSAFRCADCPSGELQFFLLNRR